MSKAQTLKNIIENKFNAKIAEGNYSATDFCNILAGALNDFLKDETTVSFSTTEVHTSSGTTETGTPSGKITSISISLSPSGLSAHNTALIDFFSQITTTTVGATFEITESGYLDCEANLILSDVSHINLDSVKNKNTFDDAMLSFCADIVTWWEAITPSTIVSGSKTDGWEVTGSAIKFDL